MRDCEGLILKEFTSERCWVLLTQLRKLKTRFRTPSSSSFFKKNKKIKRKKGGWAAVELGQEFSQRKLDEFTFGYESCKVLHLYLSSFKVIIP